MSFLFADRLFLPSILVLNDCGITKAGDRSDIAAFCAHVIELDLSYNQLNDWGEVGVTSETDSSISFICLWWITLFEYQLLFDFVL